MAPLETTVTPNSKDVREGGQEASPKRESGHEKHFFISIVFACLIAQACGRQKRKRSPPPLSPPRALAISAVYLPTDFFDDFF